MNSKTYDVIIIGAGSIGVPAAMAIAEKKLRVLVLDSAASPGQGQNKAAIGGIRATHSDGSKVKTCLRSLEIFSSWKEKNGDDIGWIKGGYAFPAYTESDERLMKELLVVQKTFGLNISWVDAVRMQKIIPGISGENLRGGTVSPDDGSASPLLSINAFYRRAVSLGAEFHFNESAASLRFEKKRIVGVVSSKGVYSAQTVINAAGANAKEIGAMAAVLRGKVDAVVLSGGLAYDKVVVPEIKRRTGWIAQVLSYPGGDEMTALRRAAELGLRHPATVKQYSPAVPLQ